MGGRCTSPTSKSCVHSRSSVLAKLSLGLALTFAWGIGFAQERPAAFFLVASPQIIDPNFRETVVLILQHIPAVSRGIIINRPLDVPLSRLMPGDETFENAGQSVYFGGPVALARLSFVFRAKERFKGAVPIFDDLYLGDDPALLRRVLRHKGAAREVRVYAGHAGWAPSQLQNEIERGSWFMTPATPDHVFHDNPASIWSELVKRASLRSVSASTLLHACRYGSYWPFSPCPNFSARGWAADSPPRAYSIPETGGSADTGFR